MSNISIFLSSVQGSEKTMGKTARRCRARVARNRDSVRRSCHGLLVFHRLARADIPSGVLGGIFFSMIFFRKLVSTFRDHALPPRKRRAQSPPTNARGKSARENTQRRMPSFSMMLL